MRCTALAAAPAAPTGAASARRQPTRPLLVARPARLPVRASLRSTAAGTLQTAASVLEQVEVRVAHWLVSARAATVGGLLHVVQRLLRWVQLATMALHLHRSAQQQQQQLEFAGAAAGGAAAPPPPPPSPSSPGDAAAAALGFISAATTGAVEQLRHTLCDASADIESKMLALECTAASVQGTLFRAAQVHQEAVRSNPAGEASWPACLLWAPAWAGEPGRRQLQACPTLLPPAGLRLRRPAPPRTPL